MPYQWIEPDLFVEVEGVAVYHCYDDSAEVCEYWYTTEPEDDNIDWATTDNGQFDVRELPALGLNVRDPDSHAKIIEQAIRAGLLHGAPSAKPPPLKVIIEVSGGVAYVVEKPAEIEVELIDRDVSAESEAANGPPRRQRKSVVLSDPAGNCDDSGHQHHPR